MVGFVSLAYFVGGGAKAIALNSTDQFIQLIGAVELLGAFGTGCCVSIEQERLGLSIIRIGAMGCHVGADQWMNSGPATVLFFLLMAIIAFDSFNQSVF